MSKKLENPAYVLSNSDIVISLQSVSKSYKLYKSPRDRLKEALHPLGKKYHHDFFALKDINLEVKKGEILGIVGRNGSGKSTLLKMITGILVPTSGKINVKGRVTALLELGSGFNPNFTGRENVYFKGSIEGFDKKQMDRKISEIIEFAEIGEYIDQPVKSYSSGMRARLAFAVSTAIEPEILILDEILSVGDALFQRKAFARMENLMKNQNTTVLFVSHSDQSVIQICSRAILLNSGSKLLEGNPKSVTMYYQKMLFAKKENLDIVIEQIEALNKSTLNEGLSNNDETKLVQKTLSVSTGDDKNLGGDDQLGGNTVPINNIRSHVDVNIGEVPDKLSSYFVPDFLSKSRLEYRNYDVDIYGICIKTLDGRTVNNLVSGDRYIYEYSVRFEIDIDNVFFGMALKTEKGYILASGNYPSMQKPRNNLLRFKQGDEVVVQWNIYNNLLNGIFYFNAGVASVNFNGEFYLNRVVDALVFKSMKHNESIETGIISFAPNCSVNVCLRK